MAKQKPAKPDGKPSRVPKKLTAELAIARVCGVGAVAARRIAAELSDELRAKIIERYQQPDAHDDIRRVVLLLQEAKQEAKAHERASTR